MKINQSQIEDLYAFTRQHYVEYYDLQTELVDHLANDIEQMWIEQPQLSFKDAKTKAFKKFGIFGFMEPIEQKQKAMSKRYMRYLWSELKEWFELPQIVITISVFLMFYFAFTTQYANCFSVTFFIIIAFWSVYKSIQLNRQFRRRKEQSNKKWMLEEIIFKQATGIGLVFMSQIYNVFNLAEEFTTNTYGIIGLALAFTLLVFINYISFELLPNKAKKLINETYPEFSL